MRRYAFFIVAALGFARPASAQYPRMAPIEQYLMDRDAEIALAKSAAPAAISGEAQILVLGRKGYETAIEGRNGFVCIVERAWQAPFDNAEFWNPKTRGAICYNPPAGRSVVPATVKRQQLILAGLSKDQVIDSIKAAFKRGELQSPAPGSMSYMMARGSRLNDSGNMAHLMFYVPLGDGTVWGAGVPNSPFFVSQDPIDLTTTLIVPIGTWSDGSPSTS